MLMIAPPLTVWTSGTVAQERTTAPVWRHGMSAFGDLKYPPGFKQFDYVNANAPKGGSACQIGLGSFDNLNFAVAGVKGNLVQGIDLLGAVVLLAIAAQGIDDGKEVLGEAIG